MTADPGPEPTDAPMHVWSQWWLARQMHRAETEGPYTDRFLGPRRGSNTLAHARLRRHGTALH